MSTVSILETLQSFLQERVAPAIKLQKDDGNNVNNYELVHPAVHIGWIPPKGYLPAEMESAIPCLIVGMDEASDDAQNEEINIRISAAVYSPGQHNPDGTYAPDFRGYNDLLNLIDRTKAELIKNQIINNSIVIQFPVKWGMYQEQPYPYWYGWITFAVRKTSYPQAEILRNL